ncbi:MAG: heparinase II/III domain-containing protein [Vicinamibacteraceae bacterium]
MGSNVGRVRALVAFGGLACGAVLAAAVLGAQGTPLRDTGEPQRPPLAYETSAYELDPFIPRDGRPWTRADLQRLLIERTGREKRRHELNVYYYRIGHTLAFPLPLTRRPTTQELPAGISTITYPWLTWLAWDLEERWRILHAAWRGNSDLESGRLLQHELAALAGWDRFHEMTNQAGLVTAHLAASLSLALADSSDWDPALLRQARASAEALIERDVWPWFEEQWSATLDGPARLHNIPVITLARSAQLARIIGSPRTDALERKMTDVLGAWCQFRTGREHHTEGASYDGYLMDSVTEWLAGMSGRRDILEEHRDAFRSVADQWIDFTLPGRPDLHAPLGDVEPEMPFWTSALLRLARWYDWQDAAWLLAHVPAVRLPAAALVGALGDFRLFEHVTASRPPAAAPHEHPHAVTLRTGWTSRDAAVSVSVTRNAMRHLHADGGHVILGWQNRFWITDPGYQQYRPGAERDYTLGIWAHNGPVINGEAQKRRAARVRVLETDKRGWQHAGIDLTGCYQGLPPGAVVQRDVWLMSGEAPVTVVRDTFRSLEKDAEVATGWTGGAHLAWAFRGGWARLSDGEHALWVGASPGRLEASQLVRHAGSRGPLTLTPKARLPEGSGVRWWIFWRGGNGEWKPPVTRMDGETLLLAAPAGHAAATWIRFD